MKSHWISNCSKEDARKVILKSGIEGWTIGAPKPGKHSRAKLEGWGTVGLYNVDPEPRLRSED